MIFGSQDDGALRAGNYSAIDHIKQMGGNRLRMVVSRERVAKEGYGQLDNILNEAKAKGVDVQMVLDNREGFGKGAGDPKKYQKFVADASKHFQGRVGTYSFINEPDLKMSSQKYRQFFLAGQKALADKKARVLFGELSPFGGLDYANTVLSQGKPGNRIQASGLSIHPYQFNDPLAAPGNPKWKWGIGRGRTMQKEIKKFAATKGFRTKAGKTPGLYFSEFGYGRTGSNQIPEDQAVKFWPRAMQAAQRAGAKEFIAYTMTGSPDSSTWDTGLLNPDGTPRPTYNALRQARGR